MLDCNYPLRYRITRRCTLNLETEVLEGKPVPLSICIRQIPRKMSLKSMRFQRWEVED